MPAYRLVFLVALVVGLLAAIATSSSQRRVGDGAASRKPPSVAPGLLREPSGTVDARLPRSGPIRAHVGDIVALRFERPEGDVLELGAFGLQEGFPGGVPVTLHFRAARAGTFQLRLRRAAKTLAELVVTQAPLLSGGTAPDADVVPDAPAAEPVPDTGNAAR